MSRIDRSRWPDVSRRLDALLDEDPPAQARYLDDLAATEPALADALRALLSRRATIEREGFLNEACAPVPPPVAVIAGERVGAYVLVRPLGEGGMGAVWLAKRQDGRFEGLAAVKLPMVALLGPQGLARFAREGQLLARLSHPSIARLFDAGVTAAGQPYLVLEYVDGQPIDRHADAHALDTTARIRLLLQVLDAVAHAHRNLVLHRDLKPTNILVTADGQVKLLDFGIAKLIEDDADATATVLTRVAGRAFTPEYAAPEQVQGGTVTTASDVYALGVLLHVLLAGRHPTRRPGQSPVDHLVAIVEHDPPPMSVIARATEAEVARRHRATPPELAQRLRGDLDNIAAKALRKSPAERYASVDALADDLRHYLRQEPVGARPATLAYRAQKFVRRNRMSVALAGLALAVLVAGLAGTVSQTVRATAQARLADEQRARADAEAREAAEQRDFALRQLAHVDDVNDLNAFLLSDAAPSGKPFTVGELLARAERIVARQRGGSASDRVERLIALGSQYKVLEQNAKAHALLAEAFEASRTLDDPAVRADAACAYAVAESAAGALERSAALVASALAELPAKPQYEATRMTCEWRGSNAAQIADDPIRAIAHAEAARALLTRLPIAAPVWELRVQMTLAEAYRVGARYVDAIGAFEQANARLVELGREDTETASTLYNNWALALLQSGRPQEAAALFEKGRRNSTAGNGDDVSPMLLTNYARTLDRLDRTAEAVALADRAFERARRAGDDVVVGQSLILRASFHRRLGRLDDAALLLDAAAGHFRRAPAGDLALASIASQRALLALARGDVDGALRGADDAVGKATSFDPTHPILAELLRRRAEAALAAGDAGRAEADARRAVGIEAKATAVNARSANLGAMYLMLARALAARRDDASARVASAQALAHLAPTLGDTHPDTRAAAAIAAP